MLFGHKRKNQNAIYLCNHWTYYETHFRELQHVELLNAKCLFGGLQKLDQEERIYLAKQYRTGRGKKYTDQEAADLFGIALMDHKKEKDRILTKLQEAVREVREAIESKKGGAE